MTAGPRPALVCLLIASVLPGCGRTPQGAAPPAAVFADVAAEAGVAFTHENGMSGQFHYAEMMGPGVALFDFDNDGDLDLLVIQGGPLDPSVKGFGEPRYSARLYRNDLVVGSDGRRTLRFTDVTEKSGLVTRGHGMGVAVGDYDGDGWVDVFVTHFGAPHQLFHNNGDGTFTDVTARAGVGGDGRWGTSATFVDYDGDGRLDLFFTNYVDFTMKTHKACFNNQSAQDYCAPAAYRPLPDQLFRNRGDGTFEDVSRKAGLTKAYGSGLGVIALDANGDGRPDLFVANDGNPNQLWINRGDGTFANEADLRGCAVNADGAPEAGMGVDAGDFDANGTDDLVVTQLTREGHTLYVDAGAGKYQDRSAAAGLAAITQPFTGFGTAFIDYDNDGRLDLVIANGAVQSIEEQVRAKDPYPLRQRNLLLRNAGEGRFELEPRAGAAFDRAGVSRGLAAGDLDNDGAIDVVIAESNGPVRILRNQVGARNAWVGLRLMSDKRDAYGARVEIRRKGAAPMWRRVRADGSYLSAQDPRILAGLGDNTAVEALVVHWPGGRVETFAPPPLRAYTTLREGTGQEMKGK
jgi:hypothetical protein